MNLLITGAWPEAKEHIAEIERMGHTVAFLQQEKEQLPCAYEWVEGVICNGLFLHHPISLFTNLRYIQLTSAGYDRVPMKEVEQRQIKIYNARGVYSIPMAEFAVAGVLDLYKDMAQFRKQQERHEWVKNRKIRELAGSKVVIVGCGSVGTECAKRFKAFDCQVIGVDVIVREDPWYDKIIKIEEIDRELQGADVVVLTVPLTEETRGLIDERRLKLIGEQGILVNIARGGIIDRKALEEWNGYAVLDVFEEEPLEAGSTLWGKEGVIVTPHNSFVGNGNHKRLNQCIIRNLEGEGRLGKYKVAIH